MYNWYGQAIFAQLGDRDAYYAKLKDFLDATLEVVEYPHQVFPAGLAQQNNVVGTTVTGPAFTFSIKLPDEYVNDPPEGNGYTGSFATEINELTNGAEMNDAVTGPL